MPSSLYGASAEYAMHSLLTLMAREKPVSVSDLARFQELPERYLAKLFTRLKNAGLIVGREGVQGGYVLAMPPEEISVRDILDAVSPDRMLFQCAEIRRHCAVYSDGPPSWSVKGMCRIHLFMKESEDKLREILATKTLAELGSEFEKTAPLQFLQDAESWFLDRRDKRTTRTKQTKSKKKPS